ncbi:hypothetical protein UA32_07645 [Photobacterium angustum]|uniref:Glycosyl transferase n=1 Tax=Photobacterium angustum TaxID=661 RepID=A0ABX5H1I3_PHOAN|nr:glycosyltransferase [Photobacterium angustum]KJG39101.1 hypothetical protein UA32_07645 [Photobacterium angustum]PSX07460.1 glycosyl transferase [Photobacterium angustum]
MKVLIVSHSDSSGGAARAAKRLLLALCNSRANAKMFVKVKNTSNYLITGQKNKIELAINIIRSGLGQMMLKLQRSSNKSLHSLNLIPSKMLKNINNDDSDIVNLHWINGETLSIKDISLINKPVVMTIHDMWAFCGSEHVVELQNNRFYDGYTSSNRKDGDSYLDLDKFIWKQKKKHWSKPFNIVAPSNWMAECARESSLFKGWEISVIPNAIDTKVFKPIDKHVARGILNLPLDEKLIGFGSWMGGETYNKGFDLLQQALLNLDNSNMPPLRCIVFGQERPLNFVESKLPFSFMGHINDDITLAILYSALDLVVLPSRIENLPQVATEAMSCGCPVVAFETAGIPDVIEHMKTGYLARAFNSEDLAFGIKKIINDNELQLYMSQKCREKAVTKWDNDIVAEQYLSLYQSILNKKDL